MHFYVNESSAQYCSVSSACFQVKFCQKNVKCLLSDLEDLILN